MNRSALQKDVFSRLELLNCPFCDSPAVLTKYEGWPSSYRVRCPGCHVSTYSSIVHSDVTTTWNTRIERTKMSDEKPEVKKVLE